MITPSPAHAAATDKVYANLAPISARLPLIVSFQMQISLPSKWWETDRPLWRRSRRGNVFVWGYCTDSLLGWIDALATFVSNGWNSLRKRYCPVHIVWYGDNVGQCGTIWDNVHGTMRDCLGHHGTMWVILEQCGTIWNNARQCGIIWVNVGQYGTMQATMKFCAWRHDRKKGNLTLNPNKNC